MHCDLVQSISNLKTKKPKQGKVKRKQIDKVERLRHALVLESEVHTTHHHITPIQNLGASCIVRPKPVGPASLSLTFLELNNNLTSSSLFTSLLHHLHNNTSFLIDITPTITLTHTQHSLYFSSSQFLSISQFSILTTTVYI